MLVGRPFNPHKEFTGALVPEALCRYKQLSPGAKICYGRLARWAALAERIVVAEQRSAR